VQLFRFLPLLAMAVSTTVLAQASLSTADSSTAFRAAGFAKVAAQWRKCADPGTASYEPGTIEMVRDLNGDGRPEALITEGSTFCHGNTGSGFDLVSKQADGSWKLIASRTGIASFLAATGVNGWPDIEIGGPGFCFPVERWNGREYRLNRRQYEGKPCR
jgi:hypothetical protein